MKTLKDINWNQVYCFYEVARKQSMRDAASILGVSVPTVSEQIKRLENLIDVVLFKRHARHISLTAEGQVLYNCAREMFEAGGRFLDAVSPNSIGGYAVRVGIQKSMMANATINLLERYWAAFAPFGTVNTVEEAFQDTLMKSIIEGNLDWGLLYDRPQMPRLDSQPVGSFEVLFCCAESVFEKYESCEAILTSLPLVRSSADRALNQKVEDLLRAHQICPEEVVETDHREFCAALTKGGKCVTTATKDVLSSAPWAQNVKTFTLGQPLTIDVYAVWLKANAKMISIRKLQEILA